jgi:hypothetical protein
LNVPTLQSNSITLQDDMMYKVFWTESGTGDSRSAGPFATKEEAYAAPMTKLYPPIRSTIQVYKIEEKVG